MDTSAISHRVVDFLVRHPPFQAMAEDDLLALAAHGRVRFHEAHEYIQWQGEPHKLHMFVIQQGTVSLWLDADGRETLQDVRGAGDMLGIDRFTGAPRCMLSARSASDVVIYAFPASDFADLLEKYPQARQFVEAYDAVTADYQWAEDARDPQQVFLHDVISTTAPAHCDADTTIRDAAQAMLSSGSHVLAVVSATNRLQSVVTRSALVAYLASGGGSVDQPVGTLSRRTPPIVGTTASVTEGVLALAQSDEEALAVTSDGSPDGELLAVVTARDLARVFGDQPNLIVQEIRSARGVKELGALTQRSRALALQYLTHAASADWLARFLSLVDASIVTRLIALEGGNRNAGCWCFCGASGRRESLTRHTPQLMLIVDSDGARAAQEQCFGRVAEALIQCGYMARVEVPFDRAFMVATAAEWQQRYQDWLRDPVRAALYLAHPLFDLRVVEGAVPLWDEIVTAVNSAVDGDLLRLLAHDCLASLPPLTFFEDAVVDESGEQTAVFRLEHSALQPLVDVGRVFGLAARQVFGTSTLERLASARTLLPEHEEVFREAAETLRILLWQQARIGIAQGTTGSELPPTLLSRQDRHVLKTGFRSIARLLEFTGSTSWHAEV